jgi:hypothetical protein
MDHVHRKPMLLCGLLLSMLVTSVGCRVEWAKDHAPASSDSATALPTRSPKAESKTPGPATSVSPPAGSTLRRDGNEAYPPPPQAAISLDEAGQRTAAQLDPGAQPELVLAGALTAGALASPLLPGNRWTRRYHLWEMGLGCSDTVTETVRRLDRLPGNRALATLDRSFSADGPDCLRRGWIPWLARSESRILLDGRDVYLLPGDFAVETLLEALARPTPSPPALVEPEPKPPIETYSNLPLHDPWSSMPFPTWRLMTSPGEAWPTLPGVLPYGPWVWSATDLRDLQTSKLRLPGCTVAAWGPNGTCCARALCPGVGIALEHFHHSGSTWGDFIVELVDYELAHTVDTGW